jgi:hypothetical protein
MPKTWNEINPGDTLTVSSPFGRPFKIRVVEIYQFKASHESATVTGYRLRMDGKPSNRQSGARKALPKGQRREWMRLKDVTAVEPATPVVESTENAATATTWTLAYRKPNANRFQRVTNWSGTWHQADELAGIFAKAHPELQVYNTTTVATELRQAAEIAAGTLRADYAEDHRNIMLDSGKRVRIFETGRLSDEILAQVPDAVEAEARFDKGAI